MLSVSFSPSSGGLGCPAASQSSEITIGVTNEHGLHRVYEGILF